MTTRTQSIDALDLLKEDHAKVKELFDRFEEAKGEREKSGIAQGAIGELKVHSMLEEEIFYPAARQALKEQEIMDEAAEEHHVVKVLIEELEAMERADEKFQAKFTVLAENVRHHIKEEEGEMFPKVRKSKLDLESIGDQMHMRKEELKADGGLKPKKQVAAASAARDRRE